MNTPFTDLDARTIDESIEQALHTLSDQQADLESRCVRDLQYLYRKEEILASAQQRLLHAALPEHGAPGGADTSWQQRTVRSQLQKPARGSALAWSGRAVALAVAVLLVSALIGATLLARQPTWSAPVPGHAGGTPTATMSPGSQVLFSDPLSQNIHSWLTGRAGSNLFFFEGGPTIFSIKVRVQQRRCCQLQCLLRPGVLP